MKKYILCLFLLVYLTNGFSQTGVMDNFDDNILDPNWKFQLSCASCYTGAETNSELQVTTTNVGGAYENFEFDFLATPIDLTANPVVKISVHNSVAFNMRIDLTDINGNATNASPTVVAIPVSASYVQYTFNFAGKFNQTTPTAATVDITKIVKAVIFINPGGSSNLSTTVFLNDLIVGTPDAPTALFSQSASTTCTGVPVTFTNTSSNRITSYAWTFGSGATPATATTFTPPSVTWSTSGTKTISLTVTGPGGTNTYSNTVTVSTLPNSAGSVSGSASQCNGSSATYSIAAVTGATGYTWSLPPGASIAANPTSNSVAITFGSTGGTISVTPVNSCGNGTASPSLAVTVSPVVTNSVSISASPSNSICSGTSVTFTASAPYPGNAPTYQWKINGTNVNGATNSTYTTATLANGNSVTVTMTSNQACVIGSPATSSPITMNVSSGGAPIINIAPTNQTICSGDGVIFTSTVTNGGPSPSYVWKQNGQTILGETDDSLVVNIVADKDVFSAVVTASGCGSGSATSNLFTVDVITSSIANVFASTPSDTVCVGATTTFTATPVNGGASPTYQWQVNLSNIPGATGTTFDRILNNDDVVTVVMTSVNSGITCLKSNPATSTPLTMKVVSSMTSAVKITSTATTICSGIPVTFTATPLRNEGASPAYQWKVNGTAVSGETGTTFTSSTLVNNDQVTCTMTSSISCAQPSTSNSIKITVTASVPPSVVVTTPSTTVCANSLPTFTANPTNGGTSPTYLWKINSVSTGAVNSTFTPSSPLTNNDVVTVTMTSSLGCASTPTATSPGVTMTVNPLVTPSVSINASATTICPGTGITFTAIPAFGGSNPAYVWKTNGIPSGATGNTYTVANLVNGDKITCEMTSNDPCGPSPVVPVTSNQITITVNPTVAASVVISSNPAPLCPATAVTFTAAGTNGGSTPVYQWKVNGGIVGTNSISYSNPGLAAGSTVTCQMTSNAACVIGSPAISNTITVNPAVPTSITISASANPICSGTTVDFTSVTSGGGTSPVYVWKNQGIVIGSATGPTYSTSSLANGDVISCTMTSDAVCATGSPATSSVTMTVTAVPAISVSISTTTPSICGGSSATFTATPVNAGASPNYQWQVNGQNVGSNSTVNTYSSSTFANNDIIQVIMSASAACAGSTATSPSKTITVDNPPSTANAGFDQYVTSTIATLAATPPASGSGVWSTAGSAVIGTSANANSGVSNLSTGVNTFTWTVTSGVCPPSSDDVVINVGSKPTTKTIHGNTNVAIGSTGEPYYLTLTPQPGSSYSWVTTSGATIASGQGTASITIDFASGTTSADIIVTEFNNYGDYTTTLHVNLGKAPDQPTIQGPNYAVVNSTAIAYSITAHGGSTYSWTVTGGATPATGSSNIISLDFGSTAGTVTLSVTETNLYGSNTATKTVSVGTAPATPMILGLDSVVTGTTTTYTIAASTGSTYLWQVPTGATMTGTTTNTVSVTFNVAGTYTLVVTETNSSGSATGTKIGIKAGSIATVSGISGSTNVLSGVQYTYIATTTSAGNSNFYWTFSPVQPTVVSRNANSITVTFPSGMTGETVSVVQDNGFGTSQFGPVSITMSGTGLGHHQYNSISYSMYPNPFSEGVNLTFNTPVSSKLSISICTMNGEILYSSNEYRTNEPIILGQGLPVGLYIIKAMTEDKVQVIKINKE